jgi:RimJ/RimL family protein N-acetyltransferase
MTTAEATVALRALDVDDVAPAAALLADARLATAVGLPALDARRARRLARILAGLAPRTGVPPQVTRAVVEAGELVGLCGIWTDEAPREARLWYLVRADRWGRGIATAAARAMTAYAHDELGITTLRASCRADHPASARVLEKAGFVEIAGEVEGLRHFERHR